VAPRQPAGEAGMTLLVAVSDPPAALDWFTLAIAVVGATTGIASLVWQAWAFIRSGPNVVVKASGGVTSFRPDNSPDMIFIVEARNVGRSPCQVSGWGLDFPDGRQYVQFRPVPGSTSVPYTIEGGHCARWLVPMAHLSEVPELLTDDPVRVKGFVHLGNGERIVSTRWYEAARSVVLSEARS
jgi:hypothetical protein